MTNTTTERNGGAKAEDTGDCRNLLSAKDIPTTFQAGLLASGSTDNFHLPAIGQPHLAKQQW